MDNDAATVVARRQADPLALAVGLVVGLIVWACAYFGARLHLRRQLAASQARAKAVYGGEQVHQAPVMSSEEAKTADAEDAAASDEAARSAASVLSASRDASTKVQRRIIFIARFSFLGIIFIFLPIYAVLLQLAPGYSGVGCFILGVGLGIPILANDPQDSRYMRSQIHKRALRYMPICFGVGFGMGVSSFAAIARGGGGLGAGGLLFGGLFLSSSVGSPHTNELMGGVMLALQGIVCLACQIRMVCLLYATDARVMPPVSTLISEQRVALAESLGERRAASLARCCFPADNPAYFLQGANYYAVPFGRAFDTYMMCMSLLLVSAGLVQQIAALVMCIQGGIGLRTALNIIVGCGNGPLLLGILYSRPVRRRIQSWLSRLGGRGMERSAAAVAALMGSHRPEQVLARAKKTFRALPIKSIGMDDLGSSSDTGLFAKTSLVPLGGCDAFISHSWHDSGRQKFGALSAWSKSFEAEHKRLPIVWLDKASIQQDDIENSLACLPVYLAGCKRLIVLAGPTYVERLWCIVEVFTYLRMGGSPEQMIVVPLAGDAPTLNFSTFDAENAKCFSPEDKRKLLQAITQAFGTCAPFNAIVRNTLSARASESSRILVAGGPWDA